MCIGIVSIFTLVVLGLSAHVNHFMGFFCKYFHHSEDEDKRASVLDIADRFPFIMSILTLLVLVPLCVVFVFPILQVDVLRLL
jgi:flagellar biosynthesis protein FlhB